MSSRFSDRYNFDFLMSVKKTLAFRRYQIRFYSMQSPLWVVWICVCAVGRDHLVIHTHISCPWFLWCGVCSAGKPWHIVSASDLYAQKLRQTSGDDLLSTARQCLTRIYPNCSRVDSSNLNPQEMWNYGCQIGNSISTLQPRTRVASWPLQELSSYISGAQPAVARRVLRSKHSAVQRERRLWLRPEAGVDVWPVSVIQPTLGKSALSTWRHASGHSHQGMYLSGLLKFWLILLIHWIYGRKVDKWRWEMRFERVRGREDSQLEVYCSCFDSMSLFYPVCHHYNLLLWEGGREGGRERIPLIGAVVDGKW